jgi:hypothetical protein
MLLLLPQASSDCPNIKYHSLNVVRDKSAPQFPSAVKYCAVMETINNATDLYWNCSNIDENRWFFRCMRLILRGVREGTRYSAFCIHANEIRLHKNLMSCDANISFCFFSLFNVAFSVL